MDCNNDGQRGDDWAFGGKQVGAPGVLMVGDTHFIICKAAKGLEQGHRKICTRPRKDLQKDTMKGVRIWRLTYLNRPRYYGF